MDESYVVRINQQDIDAISEILSDLGIKTDVTLRYSSHAIGYTIKLEIPIVHKGIKGTFVVPVVDVDSW